LAAQFGLRGSAGVEAAVKIQFRRGRKIQKLLELRHEMDLAAALQWVDAFLRGDHVVPVEIGGALLELREIFNRFQRALRAEKPLNIDAAQRGCLDPAAVRLRADVAYLVGRAVCVAVDMAIETGHAFARRFGPAVFQRVELLLRELREKES